MSEKPCERCGGTGDGRLGMFGEFIPWDDRYAKGSCKAYPCPDCKGTGKKPDNGGER